MADEPRSTRPNDPLRTRVHGKGAASRQVGPYKLLQKIGEGGMGTVWMAEQRHPVQRRVAIKLIRTEVANPSAIARFESERQAVAMMDHPNIARVLDAGTASDDGSPFFVMELVQGIPITEYCDVHKLTPAERLELFIPVCLAIHHAHQKGIIHRDLKPSNVLVGIYDGRPVAKVIDFGLAKALDPQHRLTDKTLYTEFGRVLGTVQYMSPEQARLDGVDIDTRSDIYSLGVLLYELLAGTPPLDEATVREQTLLEVLKSVREEEPPRPSHRLSTAGEALRTISAKRQIQPAKLRQILRGDLDWIVMKALDKKRERRYDSAAAFASDIERFLNGDAVVARPPSLGYQLRKFVHKHRTAVGMVVIIACTLVTGVVGTTFFAIKANQARATAEVSAQEAEVTAKRSSDVLEIVTSAFQSVDPSLGADAKMTAKDVLHNAQHGLAQSELDAEGRMALLYELGECFFAVGDLEAAIAAGEENVALRREQRGSDDLSTLRAMSNLARTYDAAGRAEEALAIYESIWKQQTASLGADHPDALTSMHNLAHVYRSAGRINEAVELWEGALEGRRRVLGPNEDDTLLTMGSLAVAYYDLDRKTEALDLMKESARLHEVKLGRDHPNTLVALNNLATVYGFEGQVEAAIELQEELLDIRKRKLGVEHPHTLTTMSNLAYAYDVAGRLEEAVRLHEETYRVRSAKLGEEHRDTLTTMNNLATVYEAMGRFEEGLAMGERVLAMRQRILGPGHPSTLRSMHNVALTYARLRRFEEALALLERATELSKEKLGIRHESTLSSMESLATVYALASRYDEAARVFEVYLPLRRERDQDGWEVFESESRYGEALMRLNQLEKAAEHLVSAYKGLSKVSGDAAPAAMKTDALQATLRRLIELAEMQGDTEAAERWQQQLSPS